jgi:hypothetical protein
MKIRNYVCASELEVIMVMILFKNVYIVLHDIFLADDYRDFNN